MGYEILFFNVNDSEIWEIRPKSVPRNMLRLKLNALSVDLLEAWLYQTYIYMIGTEKYR